MNAEQTLSPIAVKAVIVNKKGQLLIMKRSDLQWLPRKQGWDICGGMYEIGTDPEVEIQKQIKQETGLEVENLKVIRISHVDASNAQNLRYLLWIGYQAEAKSKDVALSTEHTEHQWMSKKEALKLDWPAPHREIIEAVEESN